MKELAEEQQKKTKKYKLKSEQLKSKNEELMIEIKKLNVSHPNHTIKEEKKEYSDLLGENNNSETDEIFKLKKNYKILQEKLDEEVTRSEVLKVIAEGEKQKFEKVISKYQTAQNINDELINKLKMKGENFNQDMEKEIENLRKNNEKDKEELKEKNNEIKKLNKNIQDLKKDNQKLTSLNEENTKKIKELNSQLEEYKNNYHKNNRNDNNYNNEEQNHGYKKLISVMNIGAKEENEENEVNNLKKSEEKRNSIDIELRDKRFPTARFGGEIEEQNHFNKYNQETNKKIFEFEENEKEDDDNE